MGPGDHVRIRTDKENLWGDSGTVTGANHETRSHMVETDHGLLRRNRRHLQHTGYPNVNEPHSRGEPSTPVESFEVDQPALTRTVTISGENSYAICCASSQAIRGLCDVKADYL